MSEPTQQHAPLNLLARSNSNVRRSGRGSRWVPAMLRADQSNGHDSLKACEAA